MPNLSRPALLAGALALLAASPSLAETRCGWLLDADGEWTIGEQGGYQAAGFADAQWEGVQERVSVNGNYGYECACMAVTSAPDTMTITRVFSLRSKPLSECLSDPNLPTMED